MVSHDASKNKPQLPSLMAIVIVVAVIVYLPLLISSSIKFQPASIAGGGMSPGLAGSHRNRELEDRVKYLETKLNSFLAFGVDPFSGMKATEGICKNMSNLYDLACPGKDRSECLMDNRHVCVDDLLPKPKIQPCIVYDFGIREQPEFGALFASDTFNCQVFAFDPSPITKKWYETSELQNNSNYWLMPYGAGGKDEDLALNEYDWGQISIYKYPHRVVDPTRCDANGHCKYKKFDLQKTFTVPVRTLSTIMKELGHRHIAILKVDVEGSEYRFLEAMIDDGSCRNVEQLTLEWHHYDYDRRYGTTSSPHINVLVALLKERCGLEQFWVHGSGGWPSNKKMYSEMGITLYYNEASFMRIKK